MTWPIASVVLGSLAALVTAYSLWAFAGLERAKGLRDGLRIEAESELAKAVGAKLEEVARLRKEVSDLRMQIPRK